VEWDHTGAPEADKPGSATVNLLRNGVASPYYGTQAVNALGNWEHTFGVPLVDYTGATFSIIQESLLPRYVTTYYTDTDGTLVAKNTYVMPLKDVTVTIDWVDESDALGLRPADTFIRLYRAVPGGTAEPAPGCALSVSGTGNRWTHTFEDLPTYDPEGKLYTYTVGQENLDVHYSEAISGLAITNSLLGGGVTVTKTSKPAPNSGDKAATVTEGDVVTYTITVTNTGGRTMYNTQVRDVIPAELQVGTCVPSPKSNTLNGDGSRTLIWEIAKLEKGETATITIPTTVLEAFEGYTNIAYYTEDGEEEEVIIDPVEVQRLRLTKSADPAAGSAVKEGQVITYTIQLAVKYAASNIAVQDVIPAGMTFVPGSITTTGGVNGTYNEASRTITWPEQSIRAGGETMSFQATVDKFGPAFSKTIQNVATATIKTEEGTSTATSNEVEHQAVRREVAISKEAALVDKLGAVGAYERGTAGEPIETELGQKVRYKLTLTSEGYLTEGEVSIQDELHPDVRYVAGSFSVEPAALSGKVSMSQEPSASNGNKAVWTVSGLGKDEGLAIVFEVTAPVSTDDPATPEYETRKVFANSATAIDEGLAALRGQNGQPLYSAGQSAASSNSTYHVVLESDLVGRKYAAPASPKANGDIVVAAAGDIIAYTIEVINVGDKDADKARVLDVLPAGVEFVRATAGPAPQEYEENGVTTLMWQLPNLTRADRATGQPVAAGKIELSFEVRVLEPVAAQLLENTAYYRLSVEGEAFPAVAGKADGIDGYRKTGDTVVHQTFMFRMETTVAGGLTPETATLVQPGEQIRVAAILEAAAAIHGVNTSYPVPEGLTPAPGSIRMALPNGTSVAVADSAYNAVTRTIQWPETVVGAGATRFEVNLVVEPLSASEMEKLYESRASVQLADGNGGVKNAADGPLYHQASVGFSEITKTAALIENGVAGPEDPGTEADPVYADRSQEVEYRLRVTREAGARNRSGKIIVTDVLPVGMSVVSGSIRGDVSGEGGVVSMGEIMGGQGVEWALEGLADGDVAELVFRARMPYTADDPATPQVETRRVLENRARLVDEALKNMRTPQGANVYPAGDYEKSSNGTYHYILGSKMDTVKSCSAAQDSRVMGGSILTYTITVRNTGEDIANNLLVRDRLNSALRYVDGSQMSSRSDAQFVQQGQTIGWIIPELGIGEAVVFSFRVRVEDMEAVGTRIIPNRALVGESKPGEDARAELLGADYLQPSNEVRVIQYIGVTIIVRKIDAITGERLAGAEFILRSVNGLIGDMTAVSNEDGEAIFEDVPQGKYVVIESKAPEGYIASPVWRSLDLTLGQSQRILVVPNTKDAPPDDTDERVRTLLEVIMDLGVPNAGAGARNVGDCPK
jgi:uncharacterized repeat protein (TIGR01451 family)